MVDLSRSNNFFFYCFLSGKRSLITILRDCKITLKLSLSSIYSNKYHKPFYIPVFKGKNKSLSVGVLLCSFCCADEPSRVVTVVENEFISCHVGLLLLVSAAKHWAL